MTRKPPVVHRILALVVFAAVGPCLMLPRSVGAASQGRSNVPRQGPQIVARDGDTIIIDDDARVKMVRRRAAHVRALFNSRQRWLILLAHYTSPDRPSVQGGVDDTYLFREIVGTWPLADRWEGELTIEAYSFAGDSGGPAGFGLESPAGLVQLLTRDPERLRDPAAAVVLSYRGMGRSSANGAAFDDIEQLRVAAAMREPNGGGAGPTIGVSGGVTPGLVDPSPGGVVPNSPPAARKIHDVRPIWPDAARRAGIQGVVVVELTIGTDGSVTDARVLRGIPQLDTAALECVRQWRYEPTLLNGRPVPLQVTATVSFP